eukprot:gene10764-biopygen8684
MPCPRCTKEHFSPAVRPCPSYQAFAHNTIMSMAWAYLGCVPQLLLPGSRFQFLNISFHIDQSDANDVGCTAKGAQMSGAGVARAFA